MKHALIVAHYQQLNGFRPTFQPMGTCKSLSKLYKRTAHYTHIEYLYTNRRKKNERLKRNILTLFGEFVIGCGQVSCEKTRNKYHINAS